MSANIVLDLTFRRSDTPISWYRLYWKANRDVSCC